MDQNSTDIETRPTPVQNMILNNLENATSQEKDEDISVSLLDIIWNLLAFVIRAGGILFQINLIVQYYLGNEELYLILTTSSLIISWIILAMISITIYYTDLHDNKTRRLKYYEIFIYIILFPNFYKYWKLIKFSLACRRAERENNLTVQKKYFQLMATEDNDLALMEVFIYFLEAAPQKIVQLTIMLRGDLNFLSHQSLLLITSLIGMAWCMTSYHRRIRIAQPGKNNINLLPCIPHFLWHLLFSFSRILSIAMLASTFPYQTLLACCVHIILMSSWICCFDKSPFCSNSLIQSIGFSTVLGTLYITTYILPKNGNTRYRYLFYYVVCFIECILCIYFFYTYSNFNNKMSYLFILLSISPVVSFLLSLIFMFIYYCFLHPNKQIIS